MDGRIAHKFAAAFALEHGNGHTPDALARDAPVGPAGNHVGDALLAPGGVPLFYLLDLPQCPCAQSALLGQRIVHLDEPLLGGAEDDRIVAAPAMRIGVLDFLVTEQDAAALQELDDGSIGLE